MTRKREVTKKDVADAAMIAQLIGGADVANAYFTCVEHEPRKLHTCPDCDHYERDEECAHRDEWDCVAAAIGASARAVSLWLAASNAFFTTAKDRKSELEGLRREGAKAKQELHERERLYEWVDSICPGGIHHGNIGFDELDFAEVLRDGHLPPGWKVVPKTRQRSRENKRAAAVVTGGLPMVQVNMTGRSPQVMRAPG